MAADRHDMTDFLVGPIWPRGAGVRGRDGDPRPPRWFRVLVTIEFLVLTALLGWLVSGQPGLPAAANLARNACSGPAAGVLAPADN